jgi:xylulokinase
MTDGLLVGVDIGTTGVKVVLVDPERGVIAQASRANRLSSPHPGWAEADPQQWRGNVLAALAEIAVAARGSRVAAIATTGMVPALVFVGQGGEPLRPAMLQNDARATAQVDTLAASTADADPLTQTGSVPSQQSVAPKALWLAQHDRDTWDRTHAIVGSYDWMLSMLGAPLHVEGNWALESGLYRLDGGIFEPAVDAVPGLAERLAPVRKSGDVVAGLNRRIAEMIGLPTGTPLVVGGADHVLSAYSAGLAEPGDWLIKLGGAGDILAVSSSAVADERFFLDAHTVPGLWLPNGCMATSGSLVRWVQSLLRIDDLATMDADASTRHAAEILCLPYFLGEKSPVNDPDLRGVFAGMHLGHDAADLYRSALEGIAFGFRHNADVLRSRGVSLGSATVTNGGATSLLWKQIHASVLNVPLRTVRDHPGASLGAAFAAGVGAKVFGGWGEPLPLVREGDPVEPRPELVERYDEAYRLWRGLAGATAPTMRALARR